jgi:hypothetical protein
MEDLTNPNYHSGNTYIGAVGTGIVRVNYQIADTAAGTGGFEVWSGGDSASSVRWFQVRSTGATFTLPLMTFTSNADVEAAVQIDSGLTAAKNSYIYFKDRGASKYFLGKHNGGNFVLYNYGTSSYAITVNATTNDVTLGALTGTGDAFACIDSTGKLFRSATPCVP